MLRRLYAMGIRSLLTSISNNTATQKIRFLEEVKWRTAGYYAFANCAIFLVMAAFIYAVKPQSLSVILFAPAFFFVGSMLTFVLMVQSGAALAPLAWFILGSGIYFGLGAIFGGLRVHHYTEQIFGADNLYLTQVNLLNSCSVFIVVGVALTFGWWRGPVWQTQEVESAQQQNTLLQNLFPFVLTIAIACACLKLFFFPVAENLLIRSIIGKLTLFLPSCFLLLGMLWHSMARPLKLVALILFFIEISSGLLTLSKYQVLYTILAFIAGIWIGRVSWKFMLLALSGMGLIFAMINPLITLGRAHLAYDAQNTLGARIEILQDASTALLDPKFILLADESLNLEGVRAIGRRFSLNPEGLKKPEERVRAIGRRFEVASIQGYLINEYDNHRPGNTLSNFWVTFIPRIVWPQKPIITNLGGELHMKYYNDPTQVNSSLAPTYSAEAYWNYGSLGVVLVSILLGLAIGWLTQYSFLAVYGVRSEYFIIAFPVVIWACFVESWLVSSYLGEFLICVVILLIARAFLECWIFFKVKKYGR
jgi:hypothetical protein